ncbi:MAG: methyltransferase domain-containing protein [Patescibacteria group bacterium]
MNIPMPTGRFVIPEKIVTHFHLKEGDVAADFGAGSGYFLRVLSAGVGASGRVYACEIQKQLVEKLGDVARSQGLMNIDPLWCDLEAAGGIRISDNTLDVGLLINTFFQFENKEVAIKEIHRTLRPGGILHVVDWTESFGGLGPHPEQVVDPETTKAHFESHGFLFERGYDAGDHHFAHAYRKL